ncbi:MAG: radical SAM protein, partial [Candidatus Binataceae bacterium]
MSHVHPASELPEIDRVLAHASRLFEVSRPRSRNLHLVDAGEEKHIFLVNGSCLFSVDPDTFTRVAAVCNDDHQTEAVLAGLGLLMAPLIDNSAPPTLPVRALSLAIAQKCNLGCTYCYAQQGEFGGTPKSMPNDTALAAVDLLFSDVRAGERVNLAFLGGEPLINREGLREATRRAIELGRSRDVAVTFSITTNATLITASDADFFEEHGFAVTVSLDGLRVDHDRLRPYKGGRGSFDRIIANLRPLLARQRRMQISARVTVTQKNLGLRSTLDEFLALGFHSVGFSPLLKAPNGKDELGSAELE